MEETHRGLHEHLAESDWPVNLFALGPGTESISDLFLVPLEHWSANSVEASAGAKMYFDSHRPQVESEHQLEIRRVIAMELSRLDAPAAAAVWDRGFHAAQATARVHLSALEAGFKASLTAA